MPIRKGRITPHKRQGKKRVTNESVTLALNANSIQENIASLKRTIAKLEGSKAVMGGGWRDGMLRYYRRLLAEAEASVM